MAVSDDAQDTQSSLQDGFSRVDETARRLGAQAAEAARETNGEAETYVHQGMESVGKAGQAVAGMIRERPFTALLVAGLGGAMVAMARCGR